jgi:hypothetical protein
LRPRAAAPAVVVRVGGRTPASAWRAPTVVSAAMWIFGLSQRTYPLAQVVAAMSFSNGCLVEGTGAGDRCSRGHGAKAALAVTDGADVDQPIGGAGGPR